MLTDLKLKNIKCTDKVTLYPDRDGLYLRVSKRKKRWQLSFMSEGKLRHFYAEKEYPLMSLADARQWAANTREVSETTEVLTVKSISFGHFAAVFRNKLVSDGRRPMTLKKYDLRITKYLEDLHPKDIRTITPQDILKKLRLIEERGQHEAMRQTLRMIANVFLMAKIEGVIKSNPCDGLSKVLSSKKSVSHAAITDIFEFGKLLSQIYGSKTSIQVKAALKLSALLFTRPIELREAEWSEFNLNEGLWVIPAKRMKMGEDLYVPLSTQAKDILLALKTSTGACRYVFDMGNGAPYSDVTLRKSLGHLGYFGSHQDKATLPDNPKFHSPHGFRASFRTICDEVLEWRIDVLEQQLAHLVRDTNGVAYNRTKHLPKRTLMMQVWSDFCDTLKAGDKNAIATHVEKIKGLI